MNRREFTKSVSISLLGFSFLNFSDQQRFSVEQLTGRASPALFGVANLLKEASEAFDEMAAQAQKDGIRIKVVSSYRSYTRQEQIWNGKFERFTGQGMNPMSAIRKIIEYSTIPGTSRHHWGTDLDVVQAGKPEQEDSLLARHFNAGGVYRELKLWLDEHKEKFGFFEVYTNQTGRKGFKYEPWHLSYRPLSRAMMKEYLEIDLKSLLQKIELQGSEYFTDAFIDTYRKENLMDINPDLL